MPDPQGGIASVEDIPELADYRALATSASRAAGLDPDLVHRLIGAESNWNPHARSPKGAIGLMQLMPSTAAALGVDAEDPASNLRGGIGYLASLIDHFQGDTRKAVAAYNAGPDAVAKYNGVPPFKETEDYVNKVLGEGIQSVEDIPVGAEKGIASVTDIPGFKAPVVAASASPMPETEKVNGGPTWNALRAMLKTDPQNPTITSGPPGLIEAIQSGADDTTLDTLARFYEAAGQRFQPQLGHIPPPPGELPGAVPTISDVGRAGKHLAEAVVSPLTRMEKGAAQLATATPDARRTDVSAQPLQPGNPKEAAEGANELIEGFFQAATPLIGATALENPLPVAQGLVKAWLASKVGEQAAGLVSDSQEAKRLAGNLAALSSGVVSAKSLIEAGKATDEATQGVQAGVVGVLRKAQATARSLALATKLNLGTAEQATSPAASSYGTGDVPGFRGAPYVDEASARVGEQAPSASVLKLEEEIRQDDRARQAASVERAAKAEAGTPPHSTTGPGIAYSEDLPSGKESLPSEFGPNATAGAVVERGLGSRTPEQAALYDRAVSDAQPESITGSVNTTDVRPRTGSSGSLPVPEPPEDRIASLPDGSKEGRKLVPFPVADPDFAARVIWSSDQDTAGIQDIPLADVVATQSEVDAQRVQRALDHPNARYAELPSVAEREQGVLPRAVEWQGKYYLGDGTHRAVSEWAQGHETVQAVVTQVKGGALAETAPPVETFLDRVSPKVSATAGEAPLSGMSDKDLRREFDRLRTKSQGGTVGDVVKEAFGRPRPSLTDAEFARWHSIYEEMRQRGIAKGGQRGASDAATRLQYPEMFVPTEEEARRIEEEYRREQPATKAPEPLSGTEGAQGEPEEEVQPEEVGASLQGPISSGKRAGVGREKKRGGYDLHNVVATSGKWLADVYPTGGHWSIRLFNGGQLTLEGSGGDTYEKAVAQALKRFRQTVPSQRESPLGPGIASVEDIPEGAGNEGGQRPVAGGRPPGTGVSGASARGTGTASPEGVAGTQPTAPETVSGRPDQPAGARKRRATSRRGPAGAGAATQGERQEPRGSEGVDDAGHVDTADVADSDDEADAHARGEAPRWFSITAASSLTEGNWTQKLDDNIAALKLLKALQAEGRPASDTEQQILARYVGWGHTELAPIVDLRGETVSDPRKKKARQELEQVLTKAELRELGESIANAHYSFYELPRAMWALVQRLGFKGGSILEPAVGSGHFLGTIPGEILAQRRTKVHAVDKEPIASGIARQLYQGAFIQTSPLEEAVVPDNYFDVVISNVPFGKIGIFDARMAGSQHAPVMKSVHNYYFAKALEVARPGGLIAFITSRYTMDSESDAVRRYIDQRARFVGAIRLSKQAFEKTAGTEVVTDVIVLQKAGPGVAKGSTKWVESVRRDDLGSAFDSYQRENTWVNTNEYFVAHPEMVLGKEDRSGKMNKRANDYNVVGVVTPEQLATAIGHFPADIYKPSKAAARKVATTVAKDVRQGAFVLEGGKLYTFDRGTLTPTTLKGVSLERAKAFIPLRDAYQGVVDQMLQHASDADLQTAQAALKKAYDAYVKKHGHLNTRENKRIIDADPNASRVLALENVDIVKGEKGKPATIIVTGLADIFSKRLMDPPKEPTEAASPIDALVHSIAWKGRVDLEYMSGLTNKPPAELTALLRDEIFQDVATKAWVARDEYLSGDVVTKLAQAEAAAKADKTVAGNVTALRAVQPTPITIDDFSGDPAVSRSAPFGATWVPEAMVERFVNENGGHVTVRLVNSKTIVGWYVEGYGSSEFLPPGANYAEWVAQSLNGELPTIKGKDDKGTVVTDPAATERYRQSLAQLREQWASWWKGDPDSSDQLVKIYNAMFNREVARTFDGSRLVTPNSNPEIQLRAGQKDSVIGALQRGNTLLAQAVGWGKTYEMVAIAGEWKRLGLANKPMIVVPNHLTEQWRRDLLGFYPTARVLVPEKRDFETGNRKRLVARIGNNDWDAVVLGMSQFLKVSAKLESVRAFIMEQEDQLLQHGAEELGISVEEFSEAVENYGSADKDDRKAGASVIAGRGKPPSAKDIARSILNLRKRLRRRTDQQSKDPINFEDLGVDGLIVDEAHDYKNLYFFTQKTEIVGLKGSDSDRAMDMYLKIRHINQASNNRNVVFATGTPITNTMSELFTVFRYLAQDTLDRLGMGGFDAWANAYATAVGSMEPAPEGGYKERNRLSEWSNLGELSRLFKRFADVVTTEDILKENARLEAAGKPPLLKLPKVKKVTIQLDPHPQFDEFMDDLKDRIALIKKGEPRVIGYNAKEQRDIKDNFLTVTTSAGLAAVDMRLVAPNAVADPHGRIPVAAREILKRYASSAATLGTQIVFLDSGVPKKGQIPPLPANYADPAPVGEEADDTPEDEDSDDIVDREADAEKEMEGVNAIALDRDLYGELRRLLVKGGMKDHEIAYIHQATNPSEKRRLFEAMNTGKIRVLLASRFKGGTGMNVQKKIVALHHIDVPWRPDQLEQAEGRAVRQGNENDTVDILRYVTKKSFDEYRWYLLAKKQGFISSFYRGDVASMEDVDTTQLDMQTAAALASGDARVMEMLQLERVVRGLAARYENFQRRRTTAEREVKRAEEANKTLERELTALRPLQAVLKAWAAKPTVTVTHKTGDYGRLVEMTQGRTFDFHSTEDRKALKDALVPLLEVDDYSGDGREVATAGPYVIKRNTITHEQSTEMDEQGKVTVVPGRRSAVLTVVLPLQGGREFVTGSTPEWDEDHHPDIIRSLDHRLEPDYADEAVRRNEKYIRENKGSVAASRTVLEKTFEQQAELEAKATALRELRIALGVEKAQSAASKKGPEEEEAIQVPEAVAAPLQSAGVTLKGAQADLRATLTAPEVNQPARLSSRMLRQRIAEMVHTVEYARNALGKYRDMVEAMTVSHEEILDLADAIEQPSLERNVPDKLKPWLEIREQIFDRLKKQIAQLGVNRQWYEHYLGHVWEEQFTDGGEKTKGVLSRIIGRRPLRGPREWMKKRTIPTMRQGVERGLEPKTWNLVEIDLFKMESMAKFIMGTQALNDLKREGVAVWGTALKKAPRDMVALPDTIGEVWAPPEITVAEAYDQTLMHGLESFVRGLGVKYTRKPMTGQAWGFTGADTGNITMRFGSPEIALMHEVGHAIDALFGIRERLIEAMKKNEFEDEKAKRGKRAAHRDELAALAKMRYEGLNVNDEFKAYVQKPAEQVANLVHAYLYAPDLAKKVAPHAYDAFDDLVHELPELAPLEDLQQMRSLVFHARETQQKLAGPILLGRYYVDPAVARIYKNYLTPGLNANRLWALVRVPANALTQAKLSFSAFHAFTVSMEAAAMEAARGLTDVLRGRPSGAVRFAKALAEPAAVIRRGTKAQREYLNTLDPMSLAVDSATNLLLAGGGRVKQSYEFNNRSLKKFTDHLRRANAAFIRQQQGRAGAEVLGAALRSLPALVEAASWPILQWLVPVTKAGAVETQIRAELARLPGTPTEKTLLAIASKAVNLTDATLGEVIWDNYFLPRAMMSAVHMLIMAPGWRGGSAVILARGVTDPIRRLFPSQREDYTVRVPVTGGGGGAGTPPAPPQTDEDGNELPPQMKTITVKERYWSPYTSLMIGTVLVRVLVAELFQQAHGAGHVKSALDVAHPKDGSKDANGKPTRVRLPGYAGIFFDILRDMPKSLFEYALGGTAPLPTTIGQLYENETTFGDQIVDSTDPWRTQLADYAKFLKDQFEPISVSSYGRRTGTTAEKAESLLGISPAASRDTRTPLEEYLYKLQPPAHRTKDQAEKAQARRDLKTALRQPASPERGAAVAGAIREGGLSERSVEAVTRNLRYRGPQQLFQSTTLPQAVRAYEIATPEERILIRPLLQRKVATQMIGIPVSERADMLSRVRKALQLPVAAQVNTGTGP